MPLSSRLLVLLVMLLAVFPPSVARALETISFSRLSVVDGLAQSTVTDVLQDKQGYIWIATLDGLQRYDGYQFTLYKSDPRNPAALSDNLISVLHEDRQGRLWIGTLQGGLNRFDPKTGAFVRYQPELGKNASLNSPQVTAINEDEQGRLWIGTSVGLNLYRAKTDDFKHWEHNPLDDTALHNGSIGAITPAEGGQLWLGTGRGLTRFDPATEHFHRFSTEYRAFGSYPNRSRDLDRSAINALLRDPDGTLWVATQGMGLFRLDAERELSHFRQGNSASALASADVTSLLRDQSGQLWLGTAAGLHRWLGDNVGFERLARNAADPQTLSSDEITTLLQDRSGLLWVGTAGGGLNRTALHQDNFGRLIHEPLSDDSLSHNSVLDMLEDSSGTIWMATFEGLNRYDPVNRSWRHYRHNASDALSLASDRLQTLSRDSDGKLWLGTVSGEVNIFDPATGAALRITRANAPEGKFSAYRIWRIAPHRDGNMWIAAEDGLFLVGVHDHQVKAEFSFNDFDSLGGAVVRTILPGRDGRVWFGTQGGGLQGYDPDTQRSFSLRYEAGNPASLSNNNVFALYEDRDGDLWVGTANGLNRLARADKDAGRNKFTSFNEADGLPSAAIYGILADRKGMLWLSTNQGLSRYDPRANTFRDYDAHNGLPGNEFNPGSALRTHSGTLYFGGIAGVAVFNPEQLRSNEFRPPIVLTEVLVRNQPLPRARLHDERVLQLTSSDNDLTFSFAALDYHRPEKNRFSYRLLGFEKDWQAATPRHEVSYTNLDPGTYTFEVKGSNNDGLWNKEPTRFAVEILPPPWASSLAYTAYLLLFGLGIYGLYQTHQRKLREQQTLNEHLTRIDRLKDEFLANTSHELRTPLNGIIGIAESLKDGIACEVTEELDEHLDLIIGSGRRLSHLVDEILDFKKLTYHNLTLHTQPVHIGPVVEHVLALCRGLVLGKSLNLINAVPGNCPAVLGDENRLQQILYNLIGNAIKFTDSGEVVVSVEVQGKELVVKVRDTGIGIAPDKQAIIFQPFEQLEESATRIHGGTGLGLAVTRQLVELHGGKLDVKSASGAGSTFSFTLPISDVQPAETPRDPLRDSQPLRRLRKRSESMSGTDATIGPAHGRILVADDEPLNLRVVGDFLRVQGYEVVCVGDGQQALEALARQPYDLLILDVMMPRLSGFEVCRTVRLSQSTLELPILLLSAKNQASDIVTGLEAGANDYVSKPVERSELLARVQTLLLTHEASTARQEKERRLSLEKAVERLEKYFPRKLAERLLSDTADESLKAERRRITTIFADLTGFTTLTDRVEPETMTELLNQYLGNMGELVEQYGGVLNEVLGDGVVAFFGAPEDMDKQEQAERAVALCVAMQREIAALGEHWLSHGLDHNIQLRIGIHQDFATVGNFGSRTRIAYRAVGSGVILAHRLQSECTPGHIHVSYAVYALTRDRYPYEALQETLFKGFSHSHRCCELDPAKVP